MKTPIYLFLALFIAIDARLFEGQCRDRPTPVVYPFNYKLYLGIWYEIEWYDDEYTTYDECIKFTYTGTTLNAFNMTLDLKESNKNYTPQQYQGHGIVSHPGFLPITYLLTSGKLSTTFGAGPPTRINHQILATDYVTYAFVWDCFNVNETHYNERMWYFNRKANPSQRPVVVDILINEFFDKQYIRKTYHGSEC